MKGYPRLERMALKPCEGLKCPSQEPPGGIRELQLPKTPRWLGETRASSASTRPVRALPFPSEGDYQISTCLFDFIHGYLVGSHVCNLTRGAMKNPIAESPRLLRSLCKQRASKARLLESSAPG